MNIFKKTFEEIKDRKIRKWLAIYTSTALTILGVFHLFSLRYDLPSHIFDTVLILLIFGFFSILTAAWFHGKEGKQKTTIKEIITHSIIFICAVIVFFKLIISPLGETPAVVEANSIAVLPFNNLSDSKKDEYFSDGVTEDILTNLSKISGLKVISRTSVMKYKNTNKNIREIGRELGVETILEGSIRRSGNRVRIVGQLIDASSDTHIWSETYDRDLEDIFAVQSEIAEKIAAALQTNLLPLEKELIEETSTHNIEAYTYYLKGRHYYYNYNDEDNERAIGLFKKALEVDSNYALALAGLADSYNQKVVKYWYPADWFDSAMVLSSKALELNSKLPEVYKALALTYDNLGERELALSNYEKAIRLNPNFATAILNYGHIKYTQAKYDDAFYWYRRANSLEPDNIWAIISIANVYKTLRCDSQAINWGKKAVSLDPNNPYILMIVADVYLYAGKIDAAKKHIDKAIMEEKMPLNWFFKSQIETVLGNYELSKKYMDSSLVSSNYSSDPEYFYAHTLLKLNKPEEAIKILKEEELEYVEFLNDPSNAITIMDYMALVEIYAILNEKEKAFQAWETAIEQGWLDLKRNVMYPYLENLKEDPRYNNLLNKIQNKINSLKSRIKKEYPEYEICNI